MHAQLELVGKQRIDPPLARNPALSGKARRNDFEAKVAFAAWARARMSDVTAGIVMDNEPRRLEAGKFIADSLGD